MVRSSCIILFLAGKIFRIALYTAAVLLIGQVPLAGNTIGGQFLNAVRSGFAWVDGQMKDRPALDSLRAIAKAPRGAARPASNAAEKAVEKSIERSVEKSIDKIGRAPREAAVTHPA